jgi:hypothetical protein
LATDITAITNPISLCAFVFSAVITLLAHKWDSKHKTAQTRQLFFLTASLSILIVAGALLLALHQSHTSATPGASSTVEQRSHGDQSPNIDSSGTGSVSVQIGNAPPQPLAPSANDKKK